MTDLSNLFRHTTRTSAPISSPNTHPSPLPSKRLSPSSVSRASSWNMGELESLVSKSVKKEVESESVQKQLQIFNESQIHILPRKVGLMLFTAILPMLVFNPEGHITFLLILMLITQYLPLQAVSNQNWTAFTNTFKCLKLMLYNCVFYLILKQMSGDLSTNLSWPFVFHSILANFTHEVSQFYRPIFQLQAAQNLVVASAEAMTLRKLPHFGKYMAKRIVFVFKSGKNILLANLCCGIILSLVMAWLELFEANFIALSYYLRSLLAFVVLELFLEVESFINIVYGDPIRVIKDKMPVFLTLLKLSNRPVYKQIHESCLRSLYSHVHDSQFYLSIQTCKSLTYKTYMDIFNQYAEIQLIRIQSLVAGSLISVKSNQRVINSSKVLLDDIFIYGKKLYGYMKIEWEVMNMLRVLANSSFLMAIIVESEKQASVGKESVRISPRVIENTRSIQEKLIQAAETASLSKLARQQLIAHSMRMSSWIFWLKSSD